MGKVKSKENIAVVKARISHHQKHIRHLQSLKGFNWNSADRQLPLGDLKIPLKGDTTPVFGNTSPLSEPDMHMEIIIIP